MVKIITDSACDMTREEAEALGVELLPITITFGGEEFIDGVTMSPREFYEKLIECDKVPRTSQITPFTYGEVFGKYIDAGDEVVCVTIGSKFSGSYQNACAAAQDFGGRAYVADSMNVSMGELVMVKLAVSLRDMGMSAGSICEELRRQVGEVRVLALLDTLEYIKRGGRISPTVAFAGGLLNIKPVVEVVDGEVKLVGKARGSKNGGNLLRGLIEKTGGVDFDRPFAIGWTGLSDAILKKYLADNASLYSGRAEDIPTYAIGPTIGTHVGPDCICVAFFSSPGV